MMVSEVNGGVYAAAADAQLVWALKTEHGRHLNTTESLHADFRWTGPPYGSLLYRLIPYLFFGVPCFGLRILSVKLDALKSGVV